MPSGMFSLRGPYGGGGGRGDGGGVDGTGGDDGGAGSSRYAPASMKVAEVAVDPQWQSWPSGRNGEPSSTVDRLRLLLARPGAEVGGTTKGAAAPLPGG